MTDTTTAAKITITGRNVEVPEHFSDRVKAKLAKIERLDPTLTFFHVELQHEPNPRRDAQAERIQIPATGNGTIARAEEMEDSLSASLKTAVATRQRSMRQVKFRGSATK